MTLISVSENRKIDCDDRQLKKLKAFDDAFLAKSGKSAVFDWRHDGVWARNFVGVIQVPGLTVEILPKIDKDNKLAKNNLLYMLSVAGNIPFEEREIASLKLQKMPLLEALWKLFATKLLNELRRGVDHSYMNRQENLPCVKGKIMMNRHLLVNAVHRERFYVEYDEFVDDTQLNRILKATSRRLISISADADTQRLLMEATAVFDDVSDIFPEQHHFDQLHLHRNNERFLSLLDFCQMVWRGLSPNPTTGTSSTFSLLFPMERLFEQFIARFIRRHAADFGYERREIRIQSVNFTRYLLREESSNKQSFKLQPDLLIASGKGTPTLILDTKWKCLKSDEEDRKNGVSQSDMYQMYAYSNRFDCADTLLLYPEVTGVVPKTYLLEGTEKRIRIATINLNHDLTKNYGKETFKKEMIAVISQDTT